MVNRKRVKLIDFGTAVDMGTSKLSTTEDELATPGYMPPEMSDGVLSYKTDIYSLGVSIIEVWCGDMWRPTSKYKECRQDVLNGLARIDKSDPRLGEVLKRCISTDYTKRPSIKNLIKKLKEVC